MFSPKHQKDLLKTSGHFTQNFLMFDQKRPYVSSKTYGRFFKDINNSQSNRFNHLSASYAGKG
jgi:hypothetical protein